MRRLIVSAWLVPLFWMGASSCRGVGAPVLQDQVAANVRFEYTEVHMGTRVRMVVYAPGRAVADSAAHDAYDRVAELEDIFSDYRPQSELSRVVRGAGEWVEVSDEMLYVVGVALNVARATEGAFDPTIGPLVGLWREVRDGGGGVLPPAERVDSARALVGWQNVRVDSAAGAVMLAHAGMQLDLGGIAKGFILGAALQVLKEHGLSRVLLEAGGDIVAGVAPPDERGWRVQVDGASETFAARAARLEREAIATSGSSAQFVEVDGVRRSHVIDPRSGLGVTHSLTVHVIHHNAAVADALATALSVMGRDGVVLVRQRFPDAVVQVTEVEH